MIKGLYTSFTAMEAAWQYQDVLANNLANANTIGYRREVATQQSFDDVLVSQQAGVPAPFGARIQDIIGQVGTGKFVAEFVTDFSPGSLQSTGQQLDLAAEAGFFRVEGPEGQSFYTRDGRFGRDANGDLVTSHGYRVLDEAGQRIRLPFGASVSVETDGSIVANGEPLARLAIVGFTPGQLTRSGEAYFSSQGEGQQLSAGVRQGFLEGSNTNLAEELTAMVAVQRVYQANQVVLARLDGTLEQAAGQLGRLT